MENNALEAAAHMNPNTERRQEPILHPYTEYSWVGKSKNRDTQILFNEFPSGLGAIDSFCRAVMNSEEPAYVRVKVGSRETLKETRLGLFSGALRYISRAELEGWRAGQRLRGYREACKELLLKHDLGLKFYHPSVFPEQLVADRINALVVRLREKLLSTEWKQRDLQIRRTCLKNYAHTRDLVNSSFRFVEELNIQRIDLGYEQEQGILLPTQSAKDHLKNFLNGFRKQSFAKEVLFYVWHLERGLQAGPHIHFLFATGNRRVLADDVGQYWGKCSKAAQPRFFRESAMGSPFDKAGIGITQRKDKERRTALLRNCFWVLAHKDLYIRAALKKRQRSFGCSEEINLKAFS